jgi:hypothetical protein
MRSSLLRFGLLFALAIGQGSHLFALDKIEDDKWSKVLNNNKNAEMAFYIKKDAPMVGDVRIKKVADTSKDGQSLVQWTHKGGVYSLRKGEKYLAFFQTDGKKMDLTLQVGVATVNIKRGGEGTGGDSITVTVPERFKDAGVAFDLLGFRNTDGPAFITFKGAE